MVIVAYICYVGCVVSHIEPVDFKDTLTVEYGSDIFHFINDCKECSADRLAFACCIKCDDHGVSVDDFGCYVCDFKLDRLKWGKVFRGYVFGCKFSVSHKSNVVGAVSGFIFNEFGIAYFQVSICAYSGTGVCEVFCKYCLVDFQCGLCENCSALVSGVVGCEVGVFNLSGVGGVNEYCCAVFCVIVIEFAAGNVSFHIICIDCSTFVCAVFSEITVCDFCIVQYVSCSSLNCSVACEIAAVHSQLARTGCKCASYGAGGVFEEA